MSKVTSDKAQIDPEMSRRAKQIVGCLGLPISADRKKVLLTRRHAPHNPAWHNKWQIAGGGLELKETPEAGVLRELWEELRVKATILYPHPIVRSNYWTKAEGDEGMDFQVVLLTYLVDIGNQTPDLTHDLDQETNSWGWFNLGDVQKLDFLPQTKDLVLSAFSLLDEHGNL